MDSSKGTEWEQVDGKVFYELVMSEPEKHFFIRLVDDIDFSNGTIILEVTRDEYIAWKKSYNEKQYFQRKQAGMVTVSLDAILENMPGMDVFVSHAGSIEEMMLEKEQREQCIFRRLSARCTAIVSRRSGLLSRAVIVKVPFRSAAVKGLSRHKRG